MNNPFPHLRLHTEYSIVDGIVRIKKLMKESAALGIPAVAMTDHGNMFGAVKFYKAAKAAGIKPIFGADILLKNGDDAESFTKLVILCRNGEGYHRLMRIVSKGYTDGQTNGIPLVDRDWLIGNTEGLIALSAGLDGDIGRAISAGHSDIAERSAKWLADVFPDSFYIELSRVGKAGEDEYIREATAIAAKLNLPVVATNDVRFIKSTDFEAHEARVCIGASQILADPGRQKHYTDQQYLRSASEMRDLFSDIPEAIENAIEIAKMCTVDLEMGKYYLPKFPIPGGMDESEYLREISRNGLAERLEKILDKNAPDYFNRKKVYEERLEVELNVIIQMGFPGYFLIVSDFIRWAKDNGIPVGPGRGSGAGSLVAYAIKITDLDPLPYDLLFERFLNPERVSMPDFDVDFCMENRDKVIDYVAQKYGRDQVSQIITYGTMAARAVVRDAGRVMGFSYGLMDKIAKLIPFEPGMTLDRAMEEEEELRKIYDNDDEVRSIIDMARSLEGLARNAGKHAGGVVIAPSALTDFTPLYCEEGGGGLVSQFDKDDVEAVGLVKFDFLGLRTLTIIDWAVKSINIGRVARGDDPIDISSIPLDDPGAYDLLKKCETTAVFQLESRGMKDLIKRLSPDTFEDVVALVALFRPGPLQSGMVDDFINRKKGIAKIDYPHPDLEDVLKPTYGVIVYQEQVMQIAQVLAGYTLGGADLLRRAMGKKKPEEMAKQRQIFVDGATKNGVDADKAGSIFDLMEKFAAYGFNKSHSAGYALLSYQTAWLKRYYPSEFMAAVLSSDMDKTDKVVIFLEECSRMGMKVLPPDINRSSHMFTVDATGRIIYGLGAVKGAGKAAIDIIIDERDKNGAYRDIYDLCRRVDTRKLNKRVLEALVKSGAMDSMGHNRATMMANIHDALKAAEQNTRSSLIGQNDLFGGFSDECVAPIEIKKEKEWADTERLKYEKDTLGLYLTGHPINQYERELHHIVTCRLGQIDEIAESLMPSGGGYGKGRQEEKRIILAGLTVSVRKMVTQRGSKIAFVTLDDRTGRVEMALFSEAYDAYKDALGKDELIVAIGKLSFDEFSGRYRISADKVMSLDEARKTFVCKMIINLDHSQVDSEFNSRLKAILSEHRGGLSPVWVHFMGEKAKVKIPFPDDWRVNVTESLISEVQNLVGAGRVLIQYNPSIDASEADRKGFPSPGD